MAARPTSHGAISALGLGVIVAVLLAACAGGAAATGPRGPSADRPDGAPWPHAHLLPLIDGHNYRYLFETDGGRESWLAKVSRQSETSGSIHFPNGTKRFEYRPDGITLDRAPTAVYVLRLPLVVGNRWPGPEGSSVEIVAVDATAETPAGRFVGCVTTIEQRAGDRPIRITTTFCPEVGIVELEAASGAAVERAVLESFGPPVEIGPGGELRALE
jgi:hypothetical protein